MISSRMAQTHYAKSPRHDVAFFMKLRTHSAGARFRDALPKRKEAWLKLASLPFKAYTVLAFWVVVIHELSVPGRIRDGSLRGEIVLGYLIAIFAFACLVKANRKWGADEEERLCKWGMVVAALCVLCLIYRHL